MKRSALFAYSLKLIQGLKTPTIFAGHHGGMMAGGGRHVMLIPRVMVSNTKPLRAKNAGQKAEMAVHISHERSH